MSEPLSERALERLRAIAADDVAQPDVPPAVLPERYEVVRELGRGGMGVVYEAIDRQLGRRCAVKMLGAVAGAHDDVRRRFAHEALAAARLRHPHIAAVYDATPDYISMQLVVGCAIDAVHSSDRRLLAQLVRDAARALQHAHEQGIVHRDLKPSNLLVEGQHVFVVDFGLAKAIDATESLSLAGAVVGTPAFMPPEQALGRAIDARSDVYGLGATLYHCLAGTPPFAAADLPSLLRAVVEQEPRRLLCEPDLDLVVQKCLAKEPERRYQTAAALAEDLDRWLRHEPVTARRPSLRYRLQKALQRQRTLWRTAAAAALLAIGLTALVLVPIALHQSVMRSAANEAVELADQLATVVRDAALFTRLGDRDSARQELDDGIARTREFLSRHEVPRARYLLGRLLRANGQDDLALDELQRTLAADPAFADARFERGLLLAARWDLGEEERRLAIDDLGVDVSAHSVLGDVDLLFGRAERLRLSGQNLQAKELLGEVLEYDVTHVAARTSLSRVLLALEEPDLARQYSASAFDMMQGLGPLYVARERKELPISILGLDGALVDFAAELRDGPDNALGWAHRGLVQLRRALRLEGEGRGAEALAAAQSAVQDYTATLMVHDGLPGALNNRAVCLLVAERLNAKASDAGSAAAMRKEAKTDLERAMARAPDMPEAHFNLGLLLLREDAVLRALGRLQGAEVRADAVKASFAKALDLAPPQWPHATACRERLAAADALQRRG